jgi:homocysteine S-methyltransferase
MSEHTVLGELLNMATLAAKAYIGNRDFLISKMPQAAKTRPPRPKFSTHVATTPFSVIDGALATHLESLGQDISGALWSAETLLKEPMLIAETHMDYYRSGANVAITASYQASVPGLVKHLAMSEDEAMDLVRNSVELASKARDEYEAECPGVQLFIAGSVGPYGAFLADGSEYRGDYVVGKEEMKDFHRGRIEALVQAGVDVLACETMPTKGEVEALLELLTTEFPHTEAWFTFTLRDGKHISDGTPLQEIAKMFEGEGQVVAVGVNCVADDFVGEAIGELMKGLTGATVIVYPNSGETWNAKARSWGGQRTDGASLAEKTVKWHKAGAKMIGGCCRTTPEDIKTMSAALEKYVTDAGGQGNASGEARG